MLDALDDRSPRTPSGVAVGPLVLNVANREPGMVAVMAATLQEASGGRLLLGIGAGGGPGTPYPEEQCALGRSVAGDAARGGRSRAPIETFRDVWTGRDGFLRPIPRLRSSSAVSVRRWQRLPAASATGSTHPRAILSSPT